MVVLGFIVEGDSEKVVLESQAFRNYLTSKSISFIPDVANATGNGNLLPHNIGSHTQILIDKGATHILILTDLDADACVTETKKRIKAPNNHTLVVVPKQLEAWYLADSSTLTTLFGKPYQYPDPETPQDAFNTLKQEAIQQTGQGLARKKVPLAQKMVANGFTIENAAQHPNCPSAKYFIAKLKAIAAGAI